MDHDEGLDDHGLDSHETPCAEDHPPLCSSAFWPFWAIMMQRPSFVWERVDGCTSSRMLQVDYDEGLLQFHIDEAMSRSAEAAVICFLLEAVATVACLLITRYYKRCATEVFVPETVKMDQIALSVRVGEEQLRTPLVRCKGGEATPQFPEKGFLGVFSDAAPSSFQPEATLHLPAPTPSGS